MFDLDFSKFKNRKTILFVLRLYKGDKQVEKESFVKVQMSQVEVQIDGEYVACEHAFVIKRPSSYQLPDFDNIKITAVNEEGLVSEKLAEWSFCVNDSILEKIKDCDDGKSEFRMVVGENYE